MKISLQDSIAKIVADDYRTAPVFTNNGIDFCCRAKRSLQDALTEAGLNPIVIVQDLQKAILEKDESIPDFTTMQVDKMVDYIMTKHHYYIRQRLPIILGYLEKTEKAHGKMNPVLCEILDLYKESEKSLRRQMLEEEEILFPILDNLMKAPSLHDEDNCVPLSILKYMINGLLVAHQFEIERWDKIIRLVEDSAKGFGCNVAVAAFSLLHEFNDALQPHLQMETNVLFPKAILMCENKIKARAQIAC